MIRYCPLIALWLVACDLSHSTAVRKTLWAESGTGWRTVELDAQVNIIPNAAPQVLCELTTVLETDSSFGPTLVLNSIAETANFGRPDLSTHKVTIRRGGENKANLHFCDIRSALAYRRGDTLRVTIPVQLVNSGALLHHWSDDLVLASWINIWYPATLNAGHATTWSDMRPPGKTTYTLPTYWRVVSSGRQASVVVEGASKKEVWVHDGSVARSFVAGPFEKVTYDTGITGTIDLVGYSQIQHQQKRTETFATSIKILDELFGPVPYSYHSIVEIPQEIPGFYGASEQNYILLKAQAFDDPLNSLPVLAHEAAHAWWGISVGAAIDGEGYMFMTESMAQYSAILAIEQVYGDDVAKEFMWSGAGGFSPNHDALAFGRLAFQARDVPLITRRLGSTVQHYVADSKGAWVYHMLRQKIGDEAFFGALRHIVTTHTDGNVTLGAWCEAFDQATPIDLSKFFKQWLEWEGMPSLEVSYSSDRKGAVLEQTQVTGIYELEFEVLIKYRNGDAERRKLQMDKRQMSITAATGRLFDHVVIDPNRDLLIQIRR